MLKQSIRVAIIIRTAYTAKLKKRQLLKLIIIVFTKYSILNSAISLRVALIIITSTIIKYNPITTYTTTSTFTHLIIRTM